MKVFADIAPLREHISDQKKQGKRIVLVPTMGALHEGHRACIDVGRTVDNRVLVVSIFVNPTQFGPGEDLNEYPRPRELDLSRCEDWGCDVVFTPDDTTMYGDEQCTWVIVDGITRPLCGQSRRSHFRGVATGVTQLFNIVLPDVAVFGQKDAQQALVIKTMVDQLNSPVELLLAPVARERDGLAISSRNQFLDKKQRMVAGAVYQALVGAEARLQRGERAPVALTEAIRNDLLTAGIRDLEYADILQADDLSPLERIEGTVILAIAVRVGKTRLIDNAVFRVEEDECTRLATLF